ncbi:MAG: hypothetical protein HY830_26710 [Actinobacteria bacterium]|nr:hypothetical protein [Actinomycetota bacterium]
MAEERSAVGAAGAGASGGVGARAGSITIAVAVAAAGVAGVATMQVVRAVPGYSLTGDGVAGEAVILGVAWVTCLVGAVAWRRRPKDRTGYLLYAAGVGWLAAQWATPGAGAVFGRFAAPTFTTGLLLGGGMPLLVGHLALAYPGGRLRSRSRRTLVAIGLTTTIAVLGIGGALFFDPRQQGCLCPDNWLLVMGDPGRSTALSRLGLALSAGWAFFTAGYLARMLVLARRAARGIAAPVVVPASVVLLLTGVLFAAGTGRGYLGTGGTWAQLRLAQATALVAVSAGVGWGLLRTRRVQASLARSVVRQAETPGRQLRADLADLLGDPDLLIAHRLDDGRIVDSESRPVDLTATPERTATEITLTGPGVLLVHRPGLLDSPLLRESLASAAALALTNDRLRARTLAQVAELQASQVRIVRAGDAERRRLEHDLHDGAQQRLVGILLGLRLLRSRPDAPPGVLEQAETEVEQAIDDLRTLSHGLFPTVLGDEGLAAALHALAETHRLTVGPVPALRFPNELETTAYLVVARATAAGAAAVDAAHETGQLVVRVRTEERFDARGLCDRVAALAGSLTIIEDDSGACEVTLTLSTTTVSGDSRASSHWGMPASRSD